MSWSNDGQYLLYAKDTRHNGHWDDLYDLYSYNMKSDEEKRITHGMRSHYASLSSDSKRIAFVATDDKILNLLCSSEGWLTGIPMGGTDGTINLYSADINLQQSSLSNIRRLTNFTSGQQVYSTHWSNDGSKIVFDYSINSSRRVGIYSFADSSIKFVTPAGEDSRDALFADHDSSIVYSSDRSGIFNIYKQSLVGDSVAALTNVLGGAFMPSVSGKGDLVYSSYQWNGYKIAGIEKAVPVSAPPAYKVDIDPQPLVADTTNLLPVSLKRYNDTVIPNYPSTPYKITTTSMGFYPVLLFDNYNPHASFLDEIKAGVYFTSTDVVGKYDIFGGVTLNKLLERDIFFQFDYNDKIPGLASLGIFPQFTLTAYNLSRQTHASIGLGADTISGVSVNYNLIEVDAAFSGPIITSALDLTLGFTFDSYGVTQGGFVDTVTQIPWSSLGYTYFIGRTLYTELDFDGIAPARNSWINPLGVRSRLRVSAALDKLNNGGFEAGTNLIIPVYQPYNFVQVELLNYAAVPLFRDDDALAAKVHVGYTFGSEINNFFDFYAGGLIGMRGYPFYAIGGNKMATLNLTYRYPLFRDVNKQLLQFYLSDIYLSGFGDVGGAWNGDAAGTRFKKDVGAELRMSGFSFYAYPTAIFFDASYGLDKFTTQLRDFQTSVTYGKEWRFYFGLTFSFDIVDFGRQQ